MTPSPGGTADRWEEIGAYGEGTRPVIRRNWDIADRCALVKDPYFLRIRGLAFSHAGKGLGVHYATPGHAARGTRGSRRHRLPVGGL